MSRTNWTQVERTRKARRRLPRSQRNATGSQRSLIGRMAQERGVKPRLLRNMTMAQAGAEIDRLAAIPRKRKAA